jgi:hypothetical protein
VAPYEIELEVLRMRERSRGASEGPSEVAGEQRALAQSERASVEHRTHGAAQLRRILGGLEREQTRHAQRMPPIARIEAHQRDVDAIGGSTREHARDHRGAVVQALSQPIERMENVRHGSAAG